MNNLASTHSRLSRRLVPLVRPYWRHLAGILLLGALSAPLALLTPVPLKIAVDHVVHSQPLPPVLDKLLPSAVKQSADSLLLSAIALVVGVALLGQIRDFTNSWLTAYTGERLLRSFRANLFRHVQRLSLAYHDTQGTADSVYRIQYDATSIERIAVEGIVPFVTSALTLVAMAYVTARISLSLALVALAMAPLILLITRAYRHRLRRQSREVKKIESSALGVVQEVLGAARVVKAFGQEDREAQRFLQKSNEGMQARLRLVIAEGSFGLVVSLLTALGVAAVLWIGIRGVNAGTLTLGELLLVMGYVAQIRTPLQTLSKKIASLQGYLASAERAFMLLDQSPDAVERASARPLTHATGRMEFRHVSFAYDPHRPVLHDVSFEVEPDTCLGVTGPTGAGKTTVVNLLIRFYDPSAGEILLDGVDIRDFKLADLRDQFALVLQDPVLFSTSIAENIAYARPGASQQEIVAAAKSANAHEFICRLPEGYGTLAGERGMKLSGGERQRISLARAFLKDAPILILDEPTSSVDVKTEAVIVEAMERLTRGRTTFFITHRASTLSHCDRILRIEDGRVIVLEPGPASKGGISAWRGEEADSLETKIYV